jgi:Uma2 family endonuclease
MTYISSKTLSFENFFSQYRDNPRYELADGELIDTEPTGSHETVSGIATQIGIYPINSPLLPRLKLRLDDILPR